MNRRLHLPAAIAIGILLFVNGPSMASPDAIQWHSYKDGMERGKFEKKKIFLHFYADWCVYCKKMQQSTFVDPEVIETLNQDYIPIRVNTDLDPDTARHYGVSPIPDTWFIHPGGEPIGNRPGFISADQMKVLLNLMKSEPTAAQ